MTTARNNISPLDWKTSIVDPKDGTPTLQFIRLWQQLFGNEDGTNTTAMAAAATADAAVPQTRKINTTTPIVGGGDLTVDLTLSHANSGVTAATYGDATHIPQIAVDVDGHVTAATNVAFSTVVFASAAEVQAGTVSTKAIAPDQLVLASAPQTLTDAATIVWNIATGLNAKVTLTASGHAFGAPTNPFVGGSYALEVIQDGTGSRTATWNAAFDWGSAGTPTLSTGAGKRDIVFLYCYDAATPKFRASFNKSA